MFLEGCKAARHVTRRDDVREAVGLEHGGEQAQQLGLVVDEQDLLGM